jgi:hypothetical protein
MTHQRILLFALGLTMTTMSASVARAQRSIEAYGAVGVTGGSLSNWSKTRMYDWDQTLYDGYAQVFLFSGHRLPLEPKRGTVI